MLFRVLSDSLVEQQVGNLVIPDVLFGRSFCRSGVGSAVDDAAPFLGPVDWGADFVPAVFFASIFNEAPLGVAPLLGREPLSRPRVVGENKGGGNGDSYRNHPLNYEEP